MMYELVQVAPHTYYIQSPAKIGLVVLDETSVCLIDSGNDKSAGRKIRQILDANHWQLKAIYNTHSHADHIGGNQYLYAQTGCSIYAPGIDCAFTQHPLLEPCFLYGGCPPEDLRHKFLMAQESPAQPLTPDVLPSGFEMMPFPGHGLDMVGFRTPDDVVFLADCLSSRETLDKYGIGYTYDPAACLRTLEGVRTMHAALFVPSHAEACKEIAPLAEYNMLKIHETADRITELCSEPVCFEQLLQKVFTAFGLTMNFEQYVLIGSTLRSYLTWLRETGRVEAAFEDNLLLWKKV